MTGDKKVLDITLDGTSISKIPAVLKNNVGFCARSINKNEQIWFVERQSDRTNIRSISIYE